MSARMTARGAETRGDIFRRTAASAQTRLTREFGLTVDGAKWEIFCGARLPLGPKN